MSYRRLEQGISVVRGSAKYLERFDLKHAVLDEHGEIVAAIGTQTRGRVGDLHHDLTLVVSAEEIAAMKLV